MRNIDLKRCSVVVLWVFLVMACKQPAIKKSSSAIRPGSDAVPDTENLDDPQSACLQLSSIDAPPAVDPSLLRLSSVKLESSEVGGFNKAKIIMKLHSRSAIPDIFVYRACTVDGNSCVNGTSVTGIDYNPTLASGSTSIEAFACVFSPRAKEKDPIRLIELRKGTLIYCGDSEKAYGSISPNVGQEQLGLNLVQQYQIDKEIESLSYDVYNIIMTQQGGAGLNLTAEENSIAAAKGALRAAGPGLFAALVKKDLFDNIRGVRIADEIGESNGQQLRLTNTESPCVNDEILDKAQDQDNKTEGDDNPSSSDDNDNGNSGDGDSKSDSGNIDSGNDSADDGTDNPDGDGDSSDSGNNNPDSDGNNPGGSDSSPDGNNNTDSGDPNPDDGNNNADGNDSDSSDSGNNNTDGSDNNADDGKSDDNTSSGSDDAGNSDGLADGSENSDNDNTADTDGGNSDGSESQNPGSGGDGDGDSKTKRDVLIALYTIGGTLTLGGAGAILWSLRDVEHAQHLQNKAPGFLADSPAQTDRTKLAVSLGSELATTNQKYAALVPSYIPALPACGLNLTAGESCIPQKTYYDDLEIKK